MNYIITAASRERNGIQVAIVFVACGWEGGARPCSLLPAPPSSPQTSWGRGSYSECLLPAHGWGGALGHQGAEGRKERARRGLSCTGKRPCERFRIC